MLDKINFIFDSIENSNELHFRRYYFGNLLPDIYTYYWIQDKDTIKDFSNVVEIIASRNDYNSETEYLDYCKQFNPINTLSGDYFVRAIKSKHIQTDFTDEFKSILFNTDDIEFKYEDNSVKIIYPELSKLKEKYKNNIKNIFENILNLHKFIDIEINSIIYRFDFGQKYINNLFEIININPESINFKLYDNTNQVFSLDDLKKIYIKMIEKKHYYHNLKWQLLEELDNCETFMEVMKIKRIVRSI